MNSGTCPKCQSSNVFRKENGIKIGTHHRGVHVYTRTATSPSPIVSYVCTDCGYFENYIDDQAKLADIASRWERVGSSG